LKKRLKIEGKSSIMEEREERKREKCEAIENKHEFSGILRAISDRRSMPGETLSNAVA